jgi:phosphatidate cytidylyltransferase
LLKTRVLTALIILPATLALVFATPPWLFRILVAFLLLAGCWEFRRITDQPPAAGWWMLALQTAILAVMYWLWPLIENHGLTVLAAACLAWILMFLQLRGFREGKSPDKRYRRLGLLSALAAVTFCWYSLAWLRDRPDGAFVVFLLLLVIWASDVGAYFSGKYLGRHKLAPVISPNKTWEGVYGGIMLALLASFLWSNWLAGLDLPAVALVVMSVATTLSSVGGDLFISMHKRTVGLDDTGSLFPGHGGILDRYDSLLAGAPFFALAFGLLVR